MRYRRAVENPRILADELDTALSHLRAVHASYWDGDWRRDRRGLGRYPENELWEAVDGYLELRDAAKSLRQRRGSPASCGALAGTPLGDRRAQQERW